MSSLDTHPLQFIEMKSITWSKDSHGLFDYENSANLTTKFQIKSTSSIYRTGNDITLQNKKSEKSVLLTDVGCTSDEQNNKSYTLQTPQAGSSEEVFFIVRTFKTPENNPKGYNIRPGDLIKLGRNEYQILECKYDNMEVETYNLNTFCEPIQYQYPTQSQTSDPTQKKTCKICFSDENLTDDDNLFISPCKCKGSCEYVHIGCLRVWLNSRLSPKTQGNTLYYHWKKLECEVCKEPMPKVIEYGERKIPLFTVNRPQLPYILMENVSREKRTSKGMYLVQMLPNDQIKLGRGHQCDLRVSDISVSRLHAVIKYERDRFVIYDNNSKFGTLVLMKEPFVITTEKIGIQIGRTVISLSLKSNEGGPAKASLSNSGNKMSVSLSNLKGMNKANSSDTWEKKEKNVKNKEKNKEMPTMMKLEPKNDKEEDDIFDFGKNANMDEEMNPEEENEEK